VFCEIVFLLNGALVSFPWDNLFLMKHPSMFHGAVHSVSRLYMSLISIRNKDKHYSLCSRAMYFLKIFVHGQ
jgi:hypothetical protein